MESPKEGSRIITKTNYDETKMHLLEGGLSIGESAIDVGCASGKTTRIISEIVGADAIVCGFDRSIERIEESRKNDKEQSIDNIRYQNGSVYNMDCFTDNSFDFVWSRFLFEYLEHPLDALNEMKRITKVGGKLVVADLDGNCMFNYPVNPPLKKGLENVLSILRETGFDPFVGRKLYSFFRTVGFDQQNIKVSVLPYHQIFGTPTEHIMANWERKINILESNFKFLAPTKYAENKWVFQSFLDHLQSPDTITYSNIFIVTGLK